MPKRVAVGVVTGDKMSKTRRVEIPRLVRHPKYGKFVRSQTVCYVHDENEESNRGDTVEIIESRPALQEKALAVGKGCGKEQGGGCRSAASCFEEYGRGRVASVGDGEPGSQRQGTR